MRLQLVGTASVIGVVVPGLDAGMSWTEPLPVVEKLDVPPIAAGLSVKLNCVVPSLGLATLTIVMKPGARGDDAVGRIRIRHLGWV